MVDCLITCHLTAINQSNFRLKEYCERLMFYNPSDYGRKAEQVLWRKVFYEIIQLMKHNRKVLYNTCIMLGNQGCLTLCFYGYSF